MVTVYYRDKNHVKVSEGKSMQDRAQEGPMCSAQGVLSLRSHGQRDPHPAVMRDNGPGDLETANQASAPEPLVSRVFIQTQSNTVHMNDF